MAPIPPKSKRKKYCQTYRKKWEDEVSWLYHAKVTVIPIVKYAIKTRGGVERHKDIKIPPLLIRPALPLTSLIQ